MHIEVTNLMHNALPSSRAEFSNPQIYIRLLFAFKHMLKHIKTHKDLSLSMTRTCIPLLRNILTADSRILDTPASKCYNMPNRKWHAYRNKPWRTVIQVFGYTRLHGLSLPCEHMQASSVCIQQRYTVLCSLVSLSQIKGQITEIIELVQPLSFTVYEECNPVMMTMNISSHKALWISLNESSCTGSVRLREFQASGWDGSCPVCTGTSHMDTSAYCQYESGRNPSF